ncbi:uncharacterized protein LOC131616272 [Vicia villosa]|uniref:uncharacterized protein LOC131616272 n=1 Tax=Vicia villosa TaxID=3911 RepID=UPI00273C9BF3|nr:uncharacterized protein LOC131616272 [Vicia villosa]
MRSGKSTTPHFYFCLLSSSLSLTPHSIFQAFYILLFSHSILQMHDPILSFSFILLFIIFISSILSLRKTLLKNQKTILTRNLETPDPTLLSLTDSQIRQPDEDESTPTETAPLHAFSDDDLNQSMDSGQCELKKKKKRKSKKKKVTCSGIEDDDDEKRSDDVERASSGSDTRPDSGRLLDPFNSSSSVMQKKIKPQYDELVKCNDSNKLTLTQVVQFANSLVAARSELQHKADVTQRKFVITKALLCKADRSSINRLRQQIYKLELEQKRLEEDAFVYNWLQQQLKLSPAYNKMLEIGVSMEKEKSCKMGEKRDDEFSDISFEELLAQEKKDSFWQRNGKTKQWSGQ